ncbi:hypothetical protein COK37_23475 [Bacillus thuringiensis]|uniref:hypothetical protein n=1 Tax=Bacillus thuringiensis TaxID=1428 RepID=UPI000BF71235|nr:hypothetical protein [Bacillus thuringiensis]PEV43615.1 hypothetical protein CN432_22470 [Bacillus thuringiensis]PFR65299.1 hypothetical protein COK37_23475 [Bacillus thuringiensis]PFT78280.1 hypothetical protein COK70_17700 [Bacillus thuringiensis]PFV92736.1 hypothetical protein COL06_02640 [Bacillus thuringiensis]
MLSQPMLRNITKEKFRIFFRAKEVEHLNRRMQTHFPSDYSKILDISIEEIQQGNKFTEEDLDQFIYNEIFYENSNYYYVYKLENVNIDTTLSQAEMIKYFSDKGFNVDQLLTRGTIPSEYDLCTTRLNFEGAKLTHVNFLLKVNSIDTDYRGETDFYCGIRLDITNRLLILKFRLNSLESYPKEKLAILEDIKKIITNAPPFNRIGLNYSSYNETTVRKSIFDLFKSLSIDAERLLNEQIPEDAEEKIKDFLTEMKITDIGEDYINQTKAVIYQDVSKTFQDSLFDNGWVFRFVFREGDFTRAASRTDDYSPIYSTKVYWHLKELVFKTAELQECGFHWFLNPTTKEGTIIVKLEQKNDALIFQFYRKTDFNRRAKEEYVIKEITQYLP